MSALGSRKGLVEALRSRLEDDSANIDAFSLALAAGVNAKKALLEIGGGFLNVTVEGGNGVESIRVSLSSPLTNTVGKLVIVLGQKPGYSVMTAQGFEAGHASIDLSLQDGIVDLVKNGKYVLRHRRWSDNELNDFLVDAVSFHNPNYTINTVPAAEQAYVLLKARAAALRVMASSASKRKGLDSNVSDLLKLAADLEQQYEKDRSRQQRVIPVTKIDESGIGSGDVIVGMLTRRSHRSGYTAPARAAKPPQTPTLLPPSDNDVEDSIVRLRWTHNRDEQFIRYELWRDTQPNVERSLAGLLVSSGNIANPQLPQASQFSKPSTSIQVMSSGCVAESPSFDGFFFWTYAENAGTGIINVTFADGVVFLSGNPSGVSVLGEPLEPEMDYYYRLYATNWNGEIVPSNVMRVRTRKMRALFKRESNGALASGVIAPTSGVLAGGTSITILGSNIEEATEIYIGGKKCNRSSYTSTQIVVTSPVFTNSAFIGKPQDVVMRSPTGLIDILKKGWVYT